MATVQAVDAYRPSRRPRLRRAGFFVVNCLFVLSALVPFYWMLTTSLETTNELSAGTTSLFPHQLTGQAYSQIFSEADFARPLLNSMIIALGTTVLTLLLATPASAASGNVCLGDDAAESFVVGVVVAPDDVPADHAGLFLVAGVVGAVQREVPQRGELGFDSV